MPTDVQDFGTGYKGGPKKPKTPRNPTTEHEGRVSQPGVPTGPRNRNSAPPKKAVVTVHPDGTVTATGPGAGAAKKEARASVRRAKAAVAATNKYEREHLVAGQETRVAPKDKGGGLGVDLSPVLHALEAQDPTAGIARDTAKEEAKGIWKAEEEHQAQEATGGPAHYKGPTSNEVSAALAESSVFPFADAGAGTKALSKTASAASDTETAAKAARKVVAKVKAAPRAAAKSARDYPAKKVKAIKSAPRRAKATVARAPELKTREGQKAAAKATAKTTVKHPVKTGLPAAAALPPGVEVNGFDPGQRARAFFEGTGDALLHHPGETLETTGHGVLGFLTAPVGVAAAGVSSVKQGSVAPLTDEATTLAKGTLDLGKKLASGNAKEVEETTRKETGLTPFLPVPHLVKRLKGTSAYEDTVRGSVRDAVEGRRATTRDSRIAAEKAAHEKGEFVPRKKAKKIRKSVEDTHRPGEKYVLRRTGKFIEKQRARHYVSREVARMQEEGMFAGKKESESVARHLRKSKGTDHSPQNDSDALAVILKHGLPLDHRTLDWARRLKEGYGPVEHGEIPTGVHLDRHSVQWILDHPEMFQGKRGAHLSKAVEQFDRQSENVGTSERHRYLAQVLNVINPKRVEEGKHPILLPEEMVNPETLRLLPKRDKPWSRLEALDYAKKLEGRKPRVKKGMLARAAEKIQRPFNIEEVPPRAAEVFDKHGSRQPFLYDPATHRIYLGRKGTAHFDEMPEALIKKELPGGEINFGDPHKPVFGYGDFEDGFLNGRKILSALRQETGLDIRTLEDWREGNVPMHFDFAKAENAARAKADTGRAAKEARDRGLAKEIKQSITGKPGEKGLMLPPEHGGAEGGISTTRADAYSPAQEAEFVRQARAEGARLGLRKPSAYVANHVPSGLKGEEKAPNYAAELPLRKIWPSRGLAAKSGNAQSDFEALMHGSVESPRARAAVVKGLNRVFDKASREIEGHRYLTQKQVERAINTHKVPEGTLFLRTQALKSVLEGENTLDSEGFRQALEGEITNGQALASGQIASEMKGLEGVKGEKFAPVDAAAIGELMGHLQPLGKVTELAAHGTNFATRTILNSPAFAAIQIPQEGLPLAAALGANVVNVPGALKNLAEISKLPAEDQAAIKAVVGSSVGVLGAPSTKALRAEGYMDPIRAAGGSGGKYGWRHAWNLVNGNTLGRFDRTRAGLFREIAADAKVQGDFRKAAKGFGKWRMGANNLFKGEQAAVEEMKGMNRAERMAYVSAHPKLGDKLMTAMNDMAGNWNSFTVFEKHFAPLTVFYPFQRYSVLWMLYHFPLDHPAVATALTAMGQVNAQELKALAAEGGGTPSPLDYTLPVVQNGEGKEPTVLPAGSRVFPGLSTVQQAALTKNPAALVGEASPPLAIGIEAATGKSAYTGQDIGENGFLYALRQAGDLSPLLRFLGVPETGETQSTASKAFEGQDPLKRYRSTIDPFIGQTAKQYTGTKKVEADFNKKYSEGKLPTPFDSKLVQELLYGGPGGKPQPHLLAPTLEKIHSAEAGSNAVKKDEAPYSPPDEDFGPVREKLLEEIEKAWETGPNGKPKVKLEGGGIGGGGASIGGRPLGGSIGGPSGGSIGGSSSGGIGGRPVGAGIGG